MFLLVRKDQEYCGFSSRMQQLQTTPSIDLTCSFSWNARQRWIINISGNGPSEFCLKENLSGWESLPWLVSCGKHLRLSTESCRIWGDSGRRDDRADCSHSACKTLGIMVILSCLQENTHPPPPLTAIRSMQTAVPSGQTLWKLLPKPRFTLTKYNLHSSESAFTNISHIVKVGSLWQIKKNLDLLGLWCCSNNTNEDECLTRRLLQIMQPIFSTSQGRKWPTAG